MDGQGKPRVIVRRLYSGAVIVCVRHTSGRSLWATAATLDEAMAGLRARWKRADRKSVV